MSAPRTAPVPPTATAAPKDDLDALEALIGRPADFAERVGAGRNSRVYRVRCGDADYAAKFYFRPTADGGDRLQVEFSALQFLWAHGVRCIAQPLRADAARQVALYQFLRGDPVDASGASAQDVDQVVAFVRQLKTIADGQDALALGPAAEAFFSVAGIVANVRQRLDDLQSLRGGGPAFSAFERFLREDFTPALDVLGGRAAEDGGKELPWEHRTLSPSDLGFHNALRGPDGTLAFLDFEYFGWDDPAKTLSDSLLHPIMRLSLDRRRRLARGLDGIFGADSGWRTRVARLYPLFALKWCMIMLNEFRPEQIERRRYVDRSPEEVHVIQMRQLEAARNLLERTLLEQGSFPYWGPET